MVGIAVVGISTNLFGSDRAAQPPAPTSASRPLPPGSPPSIPAAATKYCSDSNSDHAATDLVRRALTFHQTFNVPKRGDVSSPLDAAGSEVLVHENDSEVDELFAPGLAASTKTQFDESVRGQADNPAFRALDGGVSRFECTSVTRSSGGIRVQVSAVTWATIAQVGLSGALHFAQPSNAISVTATVTGDAGHQRIEAWDMAFADGAGP